MRIHIIRNGIVADTITAIDLATAQAANPDAVCIERTNGGPGWLYDGTNVTQPPAVNWVSPLEFLQRFAQDELLVLAQGCQSNAQLFVWYSKLTGSTRVDPRSDDARNGMLSAAGAGLIAADRVAEILID